MTAVVSTNGHLTAKQAGRQQWEATGGAATPKQLAAYAAEVTGRPVGARTARRWAQEWAAPTGGGPAPASVPAPAHRAVATARAPDNPTATPVRPRGRTPAARRKLAMRVLVAIMVAGAVMVGAVAAVTSYTHIRDLAELHGAGHLAPWLPLGIDGLVLVCTCSLMIERNLVAGLGVLLGLAATVWANVLAVPPDSVAQLFAAYSPLALAVVVHLTLRQVQALLEGP